MAHAHDLPMFAALAGSALSGLVLGRLVARGTGKVLDVAAVAGVATLHAVTITLTENIGVLSWSDALIAACMIAAGVVVIASAWDWARGRALPHGVAWLKATARAWALLVPSAACVLSTGLAWYMAEFSVGKVQMLCGLGGAAPYYAFGTREA